MNKQTIKILSMGLCATLCIGAMSAGVYALNNQEPLQTSQPKTERNVQNENGTVKKDEAVYVLAGADGTVQKIIVSDWISNALAKQEVEDASGLENVTTVKGEETYTLDGENMKVWDAQGNDLYYQGDIEKELPVNLAVSYTLDGQSISASELAGKSGHVKIRFDYTNDQYEMVNIDGVQEKIYVPFAILSGMVLDNDIFKNVEVSGGKLINDGDRCVVMGMAFPGLQEDLALSKDTLEIPDYVEISADVQNFEFGMTVTLATNEIFNQIDLDQINSLDGLKSSLHQLTDAMTQLLDGSSALYDGLYTLLDKSHELTSGIDKLVVGANQLQVGANDLDSGAASLKAGTAELYSGLSQITAQNDALNGGAKQVFETLLATANTQIAAAGLTVPTLTIDNYATVLNELIASLDETTIYQQVLQTVTSKVEANRPLIETKVKEVIALQVEQQVSNAVQVEVSEQVQKQVYDGVASQVIPLVTNQQFTKDTYEQALLTGQISEELQMAVETAIEAQIKSEETQALIATNIEAQMASEKIQATIKAQVEEQMGSSQIQQLILENVDLQVQQTIAETMASDEVQKQLAAASEGAQTIISLKASLDQYNAFYLGLIAYTDAVRDATSGAERLDSGAASLKEGTAQLKAGSLELFEGLLQLKNGTPALVDGVSQLTDGSMQLSDGLKQLNEEGIQKLVNALDGNMSQLTTRLKAMLDVSKNYRNFSGISEDMEGQVKFIYRTEGIQAE